jgi:hypothetical protein
MKSKICAIFFTLVVCSFVFGPTAEAKIIMTSSEQVGNYRKDVFVDSDGNKTIYMIDSNGRVVSIITISSDGTLTSVYP